MDQQAWFLMVGREMLEAEKLGVPEEKQAEWAASMAQAVCEEGGNDREVIREFATLLSETQPTDNEAENNLQIERMLEAVGYLAARERVVARSEQS